jgi:hypothetical protein
MKRKLLLVSNFLLNCRTGEEKKSEKVNYDDGFEVLG